MVSFKALALAAAVAGANAATESICDKYTTALLKNNTGANQYTLLTLLVKTAVVGNFTGPGSKLASLPGSMVKVPGILTPGSVNGTAVNLAPYFTGELATTNVNGKPTGVNWLDINTTMLVTNATYLGDSGSNGYTLLSHLVEYFGAALGCSEYGMTGFPAYGGDNSMTDVHRFMDLNSADLAYFIMNVGLAAKSFGAADSDVTTVGNLLNSVFAYRCAPAAMVIPNTPAELQAICLASSCPMATANATCAAYTDIGSTVATASTYMAASTSMAASSASATGSMMAGGSATAASSGMASSTSGVAASTGAAVVHGVSGVLAVLAGAAAFAL